MKFTDHLNEKMKDERFRAAYEKEKLLLDLDPEVAAAASSVAHPGGKLRKMQRNPAAVVDPAHVRRG